MTKKKSSITRPRHASLLTWLEDPTASVEDLDKYLGGYGVPPSPEVPSSGEWWLTALDTSSDAQALRHELAVRLGRWLDELSGRGIVSVRNDVIAEVLRLSRILGQLPDQPLRDPLLRLYERGGVRGECNGLKHQLALLSALAENQPDAASAKPWLDKRWPEAKKP